ncbi:thioesterase family protein [Halomonas sp. LS-001]
MIILNTQVAAEWVDYNGHMNDAEYARVFSLAVEALMDHIGLDVNGRAHYGYTIYTLETHLCYQRETHQGQPLSVSMSLLDSDSKRLHVFFEMYNDNNERLASSEQMLMGMDTTTVKPAPFPDAIQPAIDALPRPAERPAMAGRTIGIRRSGPG